MNGGPPSPLRLRQATPCRLVPILAIFLRGFDSESEAAALAMRAEDYFRRALACSDLNERIEDYSEAIRLDPDFAPAYNNRGLTYSLLGQFGLAVVDFTLAIELQPDYAAPYFGRGLAYLEIPTDETIGIRESVLVEAVTEQLRDPVRRTGFQHAINDFSQALLFAPKTSEDWGITYHWYRAYLYRGIAYHRLREYLNAIVDYTQAIWHEPERLEAYVNRGFAYGALRRFHEALQDAERVLNVYPDDAISKRIRALAELWRKELGESDPPAQA